MTRLKEKKQTLDTVIH